MGSTVEMFRGRPTRTKVRGSGVLPAQEIRELVGSGKIRSAIDVSDDQIQPASMDLRLGRRAYQVAASFLPSADTLIGPKIREILIREIDLSQPAILEPNNVYIAQLMEYLALPPEISGTANPKSTTGRLDIFTRLMTEGQAQFEAVRRGYSGDLYVEIVPRSFAIVVQSGVKLNQLRFARGTPEVGDEQVRKIAQKRPIVYDGNGASPKTPHLDQGVRLSIDLSGSKHPIVAYKAKPGPCPIDLSKRAAYDVCDFWEPLEANALNGSLVLNPGEFYILGSKETVGVPPDYCAEMVSYDPSIGEFTVHYAGFFDPGFGFGLTGEAPGTTAVLEVRSHEIPILLEDSRIVGRLVFLKMAERPDKIYGQNIGSSYQGQALALSKQFRELPTRSECGTSSAFPTQN